MSLLHERENNEDTESFLKQNGDKFSRDCIRAMQLMYLGERLNGETCKSLHKIHDRRLRECFAARPDVVKKAWKLDSNGKRLYVEYWINVILPPSKTEVIKNANKTIEILKSVGKQVSLF